MTDLRPADHRRPGRPPRRGRAAAARRRRHRRPVRRHRGADRPAPTRRRRSSTPPASHLFPGVVDAHQHWGIYNPLERGRRLREPRGGPGRRDHRAHLHPHRRLLHEPAPAPTARSSPRCSPPPRAGRTSTTASTSRRSCRSTSTRSPTLIAEFGVPSFKIFMFYGAHGLHGRSTDQGKFLMIPEDQRYDLAHFEFVMRGIQKAREDAARGRPRPHLAVAALRDRRDHAGLHPAGRAGGQAHGARGLQRRAAAALRGAGDHHRVVPRPRDRAAQHQPAAPHLAQGDRGGDDDAVDLPAHRLPPRGDRRPPARRLPHRRQPRRQGQPAAALRARTSSRCGSTCWPATSTGSSPTTPAARTRPSSATRATTSSWRSPASAAPSTSCAGMVSEGRKRGLSYNRIAELVSTNPAAPLRPGHQGRHRGRARRRLLPASTTAADWVVRAEDSQSTQEYTPFEGFQHDRPGHRHLRARPPGAGRRRDRRGARGPVRTPLRPGAADR